MFEIGAKQKQSIDACTTFRADSHDSHGILILRTWYYWKAVIKRCVDGLLDVYIALKLLSELTAPKGESVLHTRHRWKREMKCQNCQNSNRKDFNKMPSSVIQDQIQKGLLQDNHEYQAKWSHVQGNLGWNLLSLTSVLSVLYNFREGVQKRGPPFGPPPLSSYD